MKTTLALVAVCALFFAWSAQAARLRTATFESVADEALAAMEKRAGELHISGVAVVAAFDGDVVKGWSSRMRVIGMASKEGTEKDPGANLLAIAYQKAGEAALTHQDSGKAGRPLLTGETGWKGAVTRPTKMGHAIAAFSGGPSDDDAKVSQAGVDVLTGKL